MTKEITVIVPVYNVENYVAETINSLINQTFFTNIEIILVDDYSTDNSLAICTKYEKIYDNIKIVKTNGKGLSDARNTGLDLVETPYVMFIDSDDLFTPDACFKMWDSIRKNKLDIVVGDLEMFPKKTPEYRWKKYFGWGDQILDIYHEGSDIIWYPSACTKIFRTSFLNKEKLRFKSGLHFEDAYTVTPLMISARYIGLVDSVIYKYRKRDDNTSIMDNLQKKKNFYDHLIVNENLIQYCDRSLSLKRSIHNFVVQTYVTFLNGFHNPYVGLTETEKLEIFDRLTKLYADIHPMTVDSLLRPNNKVNLYGVFEKDYQVILDRCINALGLKITEGKLQPLIYRHHTNAAFEPENWNLLIDRIESDATGIIIKSNFNFNGIKFNEFVDAEINLKVFSNNGKVEIIKGQQYWRYDGVTVDIPDKFIGVEFVIPSYIIKKLDFIEKYQVVVDDGYQNIVVKNVQFNGLLNQYNGIYKIGADKIRVDFALLGRKLEISHVTKTKVKSIIKEQIRVLRKTKRMVTRSVPYFPRVMYYITKPILAKKKINIIGERGDTFQDNSSVLYKYCTKNGKEDSTYFLVEKDTPAYEEAKKYGKVIKMNSLKHWLYLLNADNVITSYSITGYMLPKTINKNDFLEYYADICKYTKINLQHGVTYNNVVRSMSRNRTGFDKIVVTNKLEEEYVKKSGYADNDLLKVGLPRFDCLPNKEDKTIKKILFIPTWRSDIVNKSYAGETNKTSNMFMETEYYEKINGLLTNEKLNQLIIDKELEFVFKPHYEIEEFIDTFTFDDNIKLKPEVNVQQSLIDADLIITDYSSVFWDGIFMNKPILYYQFDKEKFNGLHYSEGYISFNDDSYGKVLKEEGKLVDVICDYVTNDYETVSEKTREELFGYYSDSSCEKITSEILS